MAGRGNAPKVERYGFLWEPYETDLSIEMQAIRLGGTWRSARTGKDCGLGLFHHYKRMISLIWPEHMWHKWSELILKTYLENKIIGIMGPASSGKTHDCAIDMLADYYVFADCTTVLVSSTERESLEMRVWGEIKKYHRMAQERFPESIPGHMIESRQRIVTDSKSEYAEGRDFRSGILGIALRKGSNWQGLGALAGIKNKRLRLMADELHLCPRVFIDSISNLSKNPDYRILGIGNPKDPLDALGNLCEPAAHIGGWDSGIDQTPETKVWPTRFQHGVCIQLPGSDSPNLDGKLGIPLINQAQIDADVAFFGRESVQFCMMDMGRMPRGQGLRRVITRQQCLKFGAMEQPVWRNEAITKIGGLDASYSAVDEGDRSIFTEIHFGYDVNGDMLLALVESILVPISASDKEIPEDQVAIFLKNECQRRGIVAENVFFDSTGRGTLMSAFARLWSPNIVPVEFGGKPTERIVNADVRVTGRDYFGKRVSQLWFAVAHTIQAGQFRGMTEEVLLEGCAREWGFTASNRIDVEPKALTKTKTGRSPDLFDSLAVAVEGALQRGFSIKGKVSEGAKHHDQAWKKRFTDRMEQMDARHTLTYS